MLNQIEKERYSRQVTFWGAENQLKLKAKKVVILGAGGLGCPVLIYLAAAGVGRLTICDDDVLQLSNLNRQVLYSKRNLGENKAASAAEILTKYNDQIDICKVEKRIDVKNFVEIVGGCDLFIDTCDDVKSKEWINRLVVQQHIPAIMSTVLGCGGFAFINEQDSACWACLFNEVVEYGKRKRILPFEKIPNFGAPIGMLGSLIANMSVRYLLDQGEPFLNTLFYLPQLWRFRKLEVINRALSHMMSDHFKDAISAQEPKFPRGDWFLLQNQIKKDPHCSVCAGTDL